MLMYLFFFSSLHRSDADSARILQCTRAPQVVCARELSIILFAADLTVVTVVTVINALIFFGNALVINVSLAVRII